MDIAFNINYLGLEGLGATLCSLIRNCSNNKELTLWFLCSNLENKDKDNIRQLLNSENFGGKIEIVDFDAKERFGYMKPLHGDWTAYGRLLIADYINNDVALYLDADLVVNLDVLELKKVEFNDELLAAANGNAVKYQLENLFFITKLGWNSETLYFNSGVMLLNLRKWRLNNIEKKWKQLSIEFSQEFLSADQTLLNAICEGKFASLPDCFNNFWYPNKKQAELNDDNSILHFVGSPKPWDFFGSLIHYGHSIWKSYNTTFWENHYSRISQDKLYRFWKIRRSLLKHLKNKYF